MNTYGGRSKQAPGERDAEASLPWPIALPIEAGDENREKAPALLGRHSPPSVLHDELCPLAAVLVRGALPCSFTRRGRSDPRLGTEGGVDGRKALPCPGTWCSAPALKQERDGGEHEHPEGCGAP